MLRIKLYDQYFSIFTGIFLRLENKVFPAFLPRSEEGTINRYGPLFIAARLHICLFVWIESW